MNVSKGHVLVNLHLRLKGINFQLEKSGFFLRFFLCLTSVGVLDFGSISFLGSGAVDRFEVNDTCLVHIEDKCIFII